MYNDGKIFAVITARKGSKRLPRKNVIKLKNKPLISWTIEAAQKSRFIDHIIISTDDIEIIKIGQQYGIETPLLRPDNLSTDEAKSIDVILHAISSINSAEILNGIVLMLQPTSPLRRSIDIDAAIEMLNEDTKAVVSVCETDHSPLWSNTLPEDLSMRDFLSKKILNIRSQDLPIYYRLNGAVYVAEIEYFVKSNGFFGRQTKAYIMPKARSIDIDCKLDLLMAEVILKSKNTIK
jgi:CMP-N,N'-diacetyllegionaminic acid synthase